MRPLSRFVVWSNVFYVAPLVLAIRASFLLDAAVLGVLIICSTAFHYSREKRYIVADAAASVAVISVNAVACMLSGFKTPYFTVV